MIIERKITNKLLNNGKETTIVSDFSDLEFNTQFNEIFEVEHYKGGRIKKDMTILDVGANIGLSTLYFKPHARMIYAIEPNNDYYSFLNLNTSHYTNIKTFNVGLGISDRIGTLFSNSNEMRTETIFGTGENSQSFDQQSIDTFFKKQHIEHIDLLKIDCEGAEYPIFASDGFREVAPKIDCIIGEAHVMGSLRHEYIPEILKEYEFHVKFYPFENISTTISFYNEKGMKITKDYTIRFNTIFKAYRIKEN